MILVLKNLVADLSFVCILRWDNNDYMRQKLVGILGPIQLPWASHRQNKFLCCYKIGLYAFIIHQKDLTGHSWELFLNPVQSPSLFNTHSVYSYFQGHIPRSKTVNKNTQCSRISRFITPHRDVLTSKTYPPQPYSMWTALNM